MVYVVRLTIRFDTSFILNIGGFINFVTSDIDQLLIDLGAYDCLWRGRRAGGLRSVLVIGRSLNRDMIGIRHTDGHGAGVAVVVAVVVVPVLAGGGLDVLENLSEFCSEALVQVPKKRTIDFEAARPRG